MTTHLKLKSNFRQLTTIILSAVLSASSLAQNGSIFIESSETVSTLNDDQLEKYLKFSTSDYYVSHKLIEVQYLIEKQSNGKIVVSLPEFKCSELIFSAKNVEYTDEQNYYWHGEITPENDDPCFEGTLTLMAIAGEKFGYMIVDSTGYEYNELGNGVQLLSEFNYQGLPESECPVDSGTPDYSSNSNGSSAVEPCEGQCDIRIFVHYTQAALYAEGNINNRIALAIAQTNQAFLNSRVHHQNARVVLAGSALLPWFDESNRIVRDAARYSERADVLTTRNNNRADLMILLTNGDYGPYGGIVQAIGPNFATSFGIAQTREATTDRFVFAHEAAHLLGARHNTHDSIPVYARGYTFNIGWPIRIKKRNTIMVTGARSRIQHYSNPDVYYKNRATGVADKHDNARHLRNTGCQVGNFFPNPLPPLSGNIQGPDETCYCDKVLFEADVSCGNPPYNFQWSYSYDGIIYSDDGANSISYVQAMPCSPSLIDFIFIRVMITDGTGNTVTVTKTVRLKSYTNRLPPISCDPAKPAISGNIEEANPVKTFDVNLFPNPAQTALQVEISSLASGEASIIIVDLNGNVLQEIYRKRIVKGITRFTADVSKLNPGAYFIKVMVGGNVIAKQLIIQR